MTAAVVGIDIGGTKISVCAVDEAGRVCGAHGAALEIAYQVPSVGPLSDDAARLATLGREALKTARAVANLAIALDPEVIAVSGGMLRSAEEILPLPGVDARPFVPFAPTLVLAHFGHDAPLAGACLLALDTAALPSPRRLHLTENETSPGQATPALTGT